jgi:predicted dehydrogenase/threonine dehydrogenase-like Zn-dependent dehydrogenase
MKQIIQSFKTGHTELEDVPAPVVGKGNLLIQSTYSLVSLGTERMLVEFGKSNLISKARQQPDKVKQVLDKMRSEGIMPTLEAVFNKLEQPIPLGYCNVGKIVAVGESVSGFKTGDRVASNGHHAEYVAVPQNLIAKIPDNISDEEAAFTVIGAIGLQGIRLLNPTFGETVVVVGLGLIGLLTAQMLKANGCNVIGVDVSDDKCKLASSWGIKTINPANGDEVVKAVLSQTNNVGADGVIITASAKTNEIIAQSAQMSRKRGRIILVGVIGLDISRADFYEKELSFQVSCSYGPGRYDENYEQKGNDYPLPYVRWTEKRNFEAVLQSISAGQLKVKELITEVVDLQDYQKIYGNIGQSKSIASLLRYPQNDNNNITHTVALKDGSFKGAKGVVGIIGAGNFTKMTMLPALKGSGANFKSISSANGVTGTLLAKKYGFAASTTDNASIYNDADIDLVMITTRHNKHAEQVIQALQSGKHVFVEKPLALNNEELDAIVDIHQQVANQSLTLTVGFNRRFSPHAIAIKKAIGSGPINIIATMNAGSIPPNVWVHDLQVGGGRIIGEACHFIDLGAYFTGSKVKSVCMNALGTAPTAQTDNASILLSFEDGSNAVINYFSNGSKVYSKERLEVYSQDRTIIMDNFRKTEAFGFKGFKGLRTSLDKGHKNQFHELIRRVKEGGEPLIPFDSIINTTRASFAAIESLQKKSWVEVK